MDDGVVGELQKKFSYWFAFLALQKKIQGVITRKLVKNRDF